MQAFHHFKQCELQPTWPVPPCPALRDWWGLKIDIEASGSERGRVNEVFGSWDAYRYVFPPTFYAAKTCKSEAEQYRHEDAEDEENEDVPVAAEGVRLGREEGP